MDYANVPARKSLLPVVWLTPVFLRLVCCGLTFSGVTAGAQSLEEMQKQFLRGNYEEVIKTAQKQFDDGSYRSDWRMLLVKSQLMLGRYGEAYTNAAAGLSDYSGRIGLRLLARETALYQNDLAGANRRLAEIKLSLEGRSPSFQSGEDLVALGHALLLLGVEPRLVLENCFQRAEKLDPPPREAFLASGQIALDKHDFKLAADAFRAGLKKFPDDPDMEAGLAQAFETGNREEMLKAIEAALAVNPQHIPSLLLLADHLIDAEQYDEAEKQLALVLKVNPNRPEALAYRSVLAHLRNDPAQEKQFRADALKFWKTNPQVDYLIGRKLAQKYRFEEGAAAQRRSLDFEPDYLPARRQLAEDLLRLGQDEEGWALAQSVHKDDGYDITAYNLVTLRDQMVKFQTMSNANFIVHMSAHEAQLYGDRVLELLGRARETLCRKYGVELTRPTAVEIFPEQKDFAVRTFGMPGNPGYLGVCFGSVITANSPASQAPNPANWEDVLWHEFCHVVTLNETKNRMPRWLSEGISVYEERQANPAWGEAMNLSYRDMILNDELTPLGKLSSAFLTPKNSEHLQFAYYESSLVIEFVVQRFGFETLKKILGDLRDGDEINKAIAAHTAPLPEIEKQFDAFVRERAKNLAPAADLEKPPAEQSEAERTMWKKIHADNYYLRMRTAQELMKDKKWAEAKPVLESLANSYHGESRAENPYWLLAVAQRNLKETNAEMATLEKFAAQESDFVDLYIRLIELSEAQKNWPAVTKYVERLLAINPLISLPYQALAEAAVASGNNEQAITAYRKLLLLDPPDPADVHFQLARLLHKRGNAEAEAKRHVLESLEEAPRFRDAQRLLLEIKRETPQPTAQAATSNSPRSP
jgi:tetratricopeptide (TPR) repeat protein